MEKEKKTSKFGGFLLCGQPSKLKLRIDYVTFARVTLFFIHLIQKGCLLNCGIVHCALLHTQTATHHGCNEFNK